MSVTETHNILLKKYLSSLHDKKNGQICALFTLLKNKNAFGLQEEASAPLPTDQGLCPWNPLGFPPPDRRNRLILCTCHEPPTFITKFTPMLVGSSQGRL